MLYRRKTVVARMAGRTSLSHAKKIAKRKAERSPRTFLASLPVRAAREKVARQPSPKPEGKSINYSLLSTLSLTRYVYSADEKNQPRTLHADSVEAMEEAVKKYILGLVRDSEFCAAHAGRSVIRELKLITDSGCSRG